MHKRKSRTHDRLIDPCAIWPTPCNADMRTGARSLEAPHNAPEMYHSFCKENNLLFTASSVFVRQDRIYRTRNDVSNHVYP